MVFLQKVWRIVARWFLEWREVGPFEQAIIVALVGQLPTELGESARRHLDATSEVSYKPANQWIGLGPARRSERSQLPAFPNRDPSITAAYVFGADGEKKYRANIVVNDGVLESIAFSEPPGKLPTDASPENFEIVLVTDLASQGEKSEMKPVEELEDAQARSLLESRGASKFTPPQRNEVVDAYRRFLGSTLPGDFSELVKHVNGFKTDRWEFLGVSGRVMVWPTREWIKFIAEDFDCLFGICFVADDEGGRYHLLHEVNADLQPLDTDLPGALDAMVSALDAYEADLDDE